MTLAGSFIYLIFIRYLEERGGAAWRDHAIAKVRGVGDRLGPPGKLMRTFHTKVTNPPTPVYVCVNLLECGPSHADTLEWTR